ncbi:uncharacterized protein H6S33_006669 [Morchella sextelata]|uniref:uncharacterized protein n=1 Tax=Morchella sextelata TaxID=1174677 RepID=UPI001D056E76|nr:uncharacterized protein H6S33_006669 [Morchella sextelata]KAH0604292.1 hypothetical protein H6S33_006669 [Morchella sextelata]
MSSPFRSYDDDRVSYLRSCEDGPPCQFGVVEEALSPRHKSPRAGAGMSFCFNGSLTTGSSDTHYTSESPAGRWIYVGGGRNERGHREHGGHGSHGGGEGHGGGHARIEPTMLADIIRRNHLETDMVNRSITTTALWSEVHPKMMYNGSWPKEFSIPKTVDDLNSMDSSALDRILLAYNLTSGHSCDRKYRPHGETKKNKLWRLLEFLGADHLIPHRDVEEEIFCSRHERHGASGY